MYSPELRNKTLLITRANRFSTALSLILAPVCLFLLDTKWVIPVVFASFALLNFINIIWYSRQPDVQRTYIITSVLGAVAAVLVTLYSGGIESPFLFIIAVMVFGGYLATRSYGRRKLILAFAVLAGLWLLGRLGELPSNAVPEESRPLFSLISLLFAIYLLGGILGKLVSTQQKEGYRLQRQLQEQGRQKELLLKEIHHRVKNNLQTVSSLLNMQSRNSGNEEVRQVLNNSRNRVVSMALIHEMLYAYEDIASVDYATYVRQLANHLICSYRGNDHQINVHIDIPDIRLGIDTAIPVGLLINEFITNTLKHGIPMHQSGKIGIVMKRLEGELLELHLSDNGVGFSETTTKIRPQSLGLKLIESLVRQIRGEMETETSKPGVHYRIRFKSETPEV